MFKGYKVRLEISKKQEEYLKGLFNMAILLYNSCLEAYLICYESTGKFISDSDLKDILKEFKDSYPYIENLYPYKSMMNVVKFLQINFKKYVKNEFNDCKFKSPLSSQSSIELNISDFKVQNDRLYLKTTAENSDLNRGIKLRQKGYFPKSQMMYNPRLSFDGIDYYLSASFKEIDKIKVNENNKVYSIGIDVGVKNWLTLSNGMVFENINNTKRMIDLERKAKFIQKKKSISKNMSKKQGKGLSNNYLKLHKKYLHIRRTQKLIRRNYCYQVINQIINLNPKYIVIEDIQVIELVHENSLSKYIFEAMFREFRSILEYKCEWNDIKIIVASRYYPSSKICSNCGFKVPELGLDERTFKCPKCGKIIDRDLNAAINLSRLAYRFKTNSSTNEFNSQATNKS